MPSEKEHEKVMKAIAEVINQMKHKRELSEIVYRPDYQDYQVWFDDNNHHCVIREKLINDYIQLNHEDARRELHYILNNLIALEEWEKDDAADNKAKRQNDGMIIDNDS